MADKYDSLNCFLWISSIWQIYYWNHRTNGRIEYKEIPWQINEAIFRESLPRPSSHLSLVIILMLLIMHSYADRHGRLGKVMSLVDPVRRLLRLTPHNYLQPSRNVQERKRPSFFSKSIQDGCTLSLETISHIACTWQTDIFSLKCQRLYFNQSYWYIEIHGCT